jgi:hypothetical protein
MCSRSITRALGPPVESNVSRQTMMLYAHEQYFSSQLSALPSAPEDRATVKIMSFETTRYRSDVFIVKISRRMNYRGPVTRYSQPSRTLLEMETKVKW